MPAIDTARAAHRALRFASIDDLLAETDRIEAAERAGSLQRTGNWSVGRILGHLAAWIEYGYEGFPPGARPPWIIRVMLKFMKKKYLRSGMPRGVRIPGPAEGTFGTDDMTTDEGARRLRAALKRLQHREPARFHSPAFGPVSDDDRIAMTLRHAECHLGFLRY
jgi:hypothetical protein